MAKNKDARKPRTGQAAMEYLMTYGWVLLIIVVVISVLMSITIFHAPERCMFSDPSFTCEGPRLMSEDPVSKTSTQSGYSNLLYATITNGMPGSIQIVGMACTSSHAPQRDENNFLDTYFQVSPPGISPQPPPLILNHLDSFNTGTGPAHTFKLQCFDVDANGQVKLNMDTDGHMRAAFLKPGSYFQGNIYVLYKSTSDPAYVPPKLVTGQITVGVQ